MAKDEMATSGGIHTLDSDKGSGEEKVPLGGAKLDAALRALEAPEFLDRLTARIVKLISRNKGVFEPVR